MGLAGDFKEISFSDVVQLYCHSRRTAKLVVHDARSGRERGTFYFRDGELVQASLDGREGLEAVYDALELDEGTFHVVLDAPTPERRIFEPIGALLLEGMRRMDEAGRSGRRRLSASMSDDRAAHAPTESESMASAGSTRVCPICGKHFSHGEVCPEDGVRLEISSEPLPPARTIAPQPALARGATSSRGVVLGVGIGALVLVAGGAVILRGGSSGENKPPPKPAAAPLADVQRPAPAAPAAVPPPADRQPLPAPAPAPAPAAPQGPRGVTDTEITFGMAAPFSGSAKELGRQMKLGVETAFHIANEGGGVHGRKLRLVAVDDGYEPERTAKAMNELYEKERVFGIVGNVGTPTAVVAVPFSLERKMLFYGAFTGAPLLRRDPPDRYVFNFRASYPEETAAVVKYLVKVRRIRPEQIAVFAQQDSYGDAGFFGVAKAMRGLRGEGGNILRLGYKRNTVDVAEAVAKLRDHSVAIKAIVMVGTYRSCAKFIEKVRDFNPTMIFTNVSFVGSTALAEELALLGPKYAAGVIVTQVVPPVDSYATAILKYKEALNKYFPGEKPDYVSLEGYLAATVLVEAVKRAGPKIDTEVLVSAFEGMQNVDLGIGTPITYGLTEHQGSHKVWGSVIDEHGKFQSLDLD